MNRSEPRSASTLPDGRVAGPASRRRIEPVHLGWSIGTLGVSLQLNTFNVATLFFLVTVLKIEPLIAGALITGSKLYDAFTDPLMGAISDRTRSRWGRRRPYLMLGGLGCGVTFALLFAIPPIPDQMLLYLYVAGALVLLSTAYTVFNVPYLAMPAEMIDDYHERSVLMSYRVFLISIGTFIGVSGTPALVAYFQDHLGQSPNLAYRNMGLIIGVMMTVAMVAAFFGTRQARFTERTRTGMTARRQLRLLAENKPFLLFMGIKLAGLFSLASILTSKFFFVVYIMERSIGIAAVFGVAQLIGQIISIPFWLALSRRFGKRRVLIVSSFAMTILVLTWLFSGPAEPIWVYSLRGFALGIGGAGTILGTQAILPDVMEYDYRRTGLRREGVYAGIASFIEKTSGALSAVVIGGFLSLMDFDRQLPAGEQPESALVAIMACTALIPAGMYALKLILLKFFDLSEAKLKNATRVVNAD
jgi:GPH family glycoside/pentoside/hexuronide:cation symporter